MVKKTTSYMKGYKTYVIATLLVLVALVNLLAGDMSLVGFLADPNLLVLLSGLGLGAMRDAIS